MSKDNRPRIIAGVKLGLVMVSPEWQPRAALDTAHVLELHEAIQGGRTLPALDVVEVEDGYALVDGYHRHAAMLATGQRTCELRVVAKGDRETARWWSFAANRAHGLKRTPADKRRTVRDALSHGYAADMSNADLAEHCGVGLTLIADVRKEMEAPSPKTAAAERAAKVAAARPEAGVREIAREAGVSKDAAARAKREVSASTAANEADTPIPPHRGDGVGQPETPSLAHLAAAHQEVARIIRKATVDAEVMAGGLLPTHVWQEIDGYLTKARSEALLSSPVECPKHQTGAVCMACRGKGWVTQATANQIARTA